LRNPRFVLGDNNFPSRLEPRIPALTVRGWTAKHYVVSVIIILAIIGMFAYSWA
jgi:hypothetical protein